LADIFFLRVDVTLCHRERGRDQLEGTHPASELPQSLKSVQKKLLGTMTIRTLQNIVQKLFHIPVSDQRLYLVQSDPEGTGTVTVQEILDGLKELKYFNIESGDEITIV
jgi:hypothetical protein